METKKAIVVADNPVDVAIGAITAKDTGAAIVEIPPVTGAAAMLAAAVAMSLLLPFSILP